MNQHHAKYAFYYLLSLLALVFMAISVGIVSFQLINKYLFDALSTNSDYVSNEALRFAISALLISTPLFFVISKLIRKGLKQGELLLDSPVRRWLTYFILLVSSLVVVGSLIALINNFLSGEATWRSVLKIITVLVLGALVFSFYLQEIRQKLVAGLKTITRIYFIVSLVLVLAAFVMAWVLVDSPQEARAKRLDQVLANNVSTIESFVNTYYQKNDRLPSALSELQADKDFQYNSEVWSDPETGKEIEYIQKGEKEFELCAEFRTDTKNGDYPSYASPVMGVMNHGSGRQCFPGNLWSETKEIKIAP